MSVNYFLRKSHVSTLSTIDEETSTKDLKQKKQPTLPLPGECFALLLSRLASGILLLLCVLNFYHEEMKSKLKNAIKGCKAECFSCQREINNESFINYSFNQTLIDSTLSMAVKRAVAFKILLCEARNPEPMTHRQCEECKASQLRKNVIRRCNWTFLLSLEVARARESLYWAPILKIINDFRCAVKLRCVVVECLFNWCWWKCWSSLVWCPGISLADSSTRIAIIGNFP